jgi:hypothetical protein
VMVAHAYRYFCQTKTKKTLKSTTVNIFSFWIDLDQWEGLELKAPLML